MEVVDVGVCWNYLVVAEGDHVTKYGLVNSKPGLVRLEHPPCSGVVTQLSATPRHILSVTSSGECWTHEEGKVCIAVFCNILTLWGFRK